MPYTIDVKHDTAHRTWKRLSVVAIAPDRLVGDLGAHICQYAADYGFDYSQIAGRVVEIDSADIGKRDSRHKRVVHEQSSLASSQAD